MIIIKISFTYNLHDYNPYKFRRIFLSLNSHLSKLIISEHLKVKRAGFATHPLSIFRNHHSTFTFNPSQSILAFSSIATVPAFFTTIFVFGCVLAVSLAQLCTQ